MKDYVSDKGVMCFTPGINVIMENGIDRKEKMIASIYQETDWDSVFLPDFDSLYAYNVLDQLDDPVAKGMYFMLSHVSKDAKTGIIEECPVFDDIPEVNYGRNIPAMERTRRLMCLKHIVTHYIYSRQKKMVFFWDAPETGLHPQDMKHIALWLRLLAKTGVTIVISTADYLLVGELGVAAEYSVKPCVPIRFFCEDEDSIQSGWNLADISNNDVLEAYVDHFQHEQERHIVYMKKE